MRRRHDDGQVVRQRLLPDDHLAIRGSEPQLQEHVQAEAAAGEMAERRGRRGRGRRGGGRVEYCGGGGDDGGRDSDLGTTRRLLSADQLSTGNQLKDLFCLTKTSSGWLDSRVVSVLDSGVVGLGSNRSRDAVG